MATVQAGNNTKYASRLDALIRTMRESEYLTDHKVESALRRAPRHEFVPPRERDKAYQNIPLSTANGQTISQPIVVSHMTEWLDVHEGQKILEVGTGSGWQSAVLSYMVGNDGAIYTVERDPCLAAFAQDNLDRLAISNVHTITGDGSMGHPDQSPYDRIIVTAACSSIPPPLVEQLDKNGLLVAPVDDSDSQSMIMLQKTADGTTIQIKREPRYVFVPLRGMYGKTEV